MPLRPLRPRGSARETALRLLARRDHGAGELRRKLRQRGYSEEETKKAVESLSGGGLLSDAACARAFARESLSSGHGPAWIRAKLKSRGVTADAPAVLLEDECESLRELLKRRRVAGAALTDPKERARIMRFARGRGYGSAAIVRVLGDIDDEFGG